MIGIILAFALLPQGSNQARLHPADSLVMVEVPDVAKMLAAYEKAPMVSMMRDAEVLKAFYGAFEGSGMDFDEQVSQALLKVGLPETFASAPLAGLHHTLEGIGAASFSLSLDRTGLESYLPRVKRMEAVGLQFGAIESAIETYVGQAERTAATLPKDLAALGLDAKDTTDPWGRPFEYSVSPEGEYTLRSLGADGKQGGTGDNADIDTDSAAAAAASFLDLMGFQLVVEFRSRPALDEMLNTVAGLAAKSGATPARTGPFQMSGVQGELQSWKVSESGFENVELWLMRAQNMLVFGSGRATPEVFAARLADARVQTAADAFYAGLQRDFGAPSGATIIQGSLRLADYASAFRKFVEESGDDAEALEMLESSMPNASMRMQLVGERFVTEITAIYPEPKSKVISNALAIGPLPQELLTSIPEDAIGVYVAGLDGKVLWEAMKSEMQKGGSGEDSAQEQLQSFEQKYNFSVENDIFGSLGKGVVMYMLPLRGITSLPGMALVLDLKDAAAMQRGVEGLMAMLQAEGGSEFQLRNKPYRDAPLWTFSFGGEEDGPANPLMNAFSPSVTIVKNRLILALNSTHIKKEIKRALGEETGVHLIATEGHRPPADATAYGYMDWAHFLGGVYEGGRGLANLMGGSLPVDVASLPEPVVFTRFFKPTLYYTHARPNGTYMRNESSFGPEVWLGLLASGFVVAVSQSESAMIVDEEGDIVGESEAVPAEEPLAPTGDPSADAKATKSSMQYVATRVAVYQMDAGKYPSSLDELSKPTKNYPSGFLGKEGLPLDGWGRAFRYTALENGARYRLWSTGADGVDQQGSGDDLVSP
ncbi:MAG: type II secretion system protein GspG [Planctomycetes bacterium]|nr:type II secretion system protein GspG [Planctomycetota bacterium]